MIKKNKSETDSLRQGLEHGFCRICNSYGLLTRDHVPPQSCGNSGDIVIDGCKYQGGYKARTICGRCNNELLGKNYDLEFKKLYDEYKALINPGIKLPPFRKLVFNCSQEKLLKCFIGHFLAVSLFENEISVQNELSHEINNKIKLRDDFRRYFLGLGSLDNYDVFYWAYPYERLVISQCFGRIEDILRSNKSFSTGTVIKMYPLAIYLVDKTNSQYHPYKLPKINISMKQFTLDFKYKVHEEWPERNPGRNGVLLSSSETLKMVNLNPLKKIHK